MEILAKGVIAAIARTFYRYRQSAPEIKNSTLVENEGFGVNVRVSGDGNVLAVCITNYGGAPDLGRVVTFEKQADGSWDYNGQVLAPEVLSGSPDINSGFGMAIALDYTGKCIAVYAPNFQQTSGSTTLRGAVYTWRRTSPANSWSGRFRLNGQPNGGTALDNFALDLNGDGDVLGWSNGVNNSLQNQTFFYQSFNSGTSWSASWESTPGTDGIHERTAITRGPLFTQTTGERLVRMSDRHVILSDPGQGTFPSAIFTPTVDTYQGNAVTLWPTIKSASLDGKKIVIRYRLYGNSVPFFPFYNYIKTFQTTDYGYWNQYGQTLVFDYWDQLDGTQYPMTGNPVLSANGNRLMVYGTYFRPGETVVNASRVIVYDFINGSWVQNHTLTANTLAVAADMSDDGKTILYGQKSAAPRGSTGSPGIVIPYRRELD